MTFFKLKARAQPAHQNASPQVVQVVQVSPRLPYARRKASLRLGILRDVWGHNLP
eukprot:CAMPEP_0182904960 /NCGR_PEP_ID=MMETSP0034_2-20130328/32537_1 /TAXON_ID=156128 /ORGANISM="Nephroselmis pyriformis, Strain CCMP717" /LENGTH=54 /DNA_ID=CAMNT_0025040241 /DNA_START=3 /DNA_END=167 /DNA_ORIENTATION=+